MLMNNIASNRQIVNCSRQLSVLVEGIFAAAEILANVLSARERISAPLLQQTMTSVFGGCTDSQGAWLWKDAYDAVEG